MIDLKKTQDELISSVYSNYLEALAVYNFVKSTYKKELSIDEDKLRAKLKELNESVKDSEDKEKIRDVAIKTSNIHEEIDFATQKKQQLQKAKDSVNEFYEHYTFLTTMDNIEIKKID